MKNCGISLLPIIIGLVISVLVIGYALVFVIKRQSELKDQNRLKATQLSDLGFQEAMANVNGIEEMVTEKFRSIPLTKVENGAYEVGVEKDISGDSVVVSVNSSGTVGTEKVMQLKKFRLVMKIVGQDTVWSTIP